MVGQTILQYRVLEKLGSGGMGEIYKATDTRLNRFVAIKVLPAALSSNEENQRRFLQEAQAASALNHPNIITIYDIVSSGDAQYMVMEFVAGKTLRDLILPGGMTLTEVLQYAVQMADALSAAHGAGIIHRDLKPANVMITTSGLVKILDFGLAKLTDRGPVSQLDQDATVDQAPLTREGAIMGTVNYMSPEQAEGKVVDVRSDIFSFGSLLYEMVTGRRAFDGGSSISTLSAVLRDDVRPIAVLAPAAPPLLEQIILQCLRKDRETRWQTMKEVENALTALKRQLDSASSYPSPSSSGFVTAASAAASGATTSTIFAGPPETVTPPPPPPAAAVVPAPQAAAPAPAAPATQKPRSANALVLALAGGLIVLAAAGGGVWWWWKNHQPPPQYAINPAPQPVTPAPAPVQPATPEPAPVAPAPEASAPASAAPPTASKTGAAARRKPPVPAPKTTPPSAPATTPTTAAPPPPDTAAKKAPATRPAPPRTPAVEMVPVAIADALPFRIALAEDVPQDAPEGQAIRFTVLDGFQVGATTVVAKGASVTGTIVAEGGKKKILGMGGGKMTFRLEQADTVGGQKLKVRAMAGKRGDGTAIRTFDTGKGSKQKGLAAAQGTEYIAYTDGEQTISVRK